MVDEFEQATSHLEGDHLGWAGVAWGGVGGFVFCPLGFPCLTSLSRSLPTQRVSAWGWVGGGWGRWVRMSEYMRGCVGGKGGRRAQRVVGVGEVERVRVPGAPLAPGVILVLQQCWLGRVCGLY